MLRAHKLLRLCLKLISIVCIQINPRKLQEEQRKLSYKKKGSNNRKKQSLLVAKLHEKIANQRHDFQHKLS
ncbi:MAG: transposase, partial [Methanolobus sp.]|nr:transposase [Methanolobus sp.]